MTFDEWFKNTGSTNNGVAERLHVTPNYISMLRKGRRVPSSVLMQDISKMTVNKVPVTVWFGDKTEGKSEWCCKTCGKNFTYSMPCDYCDDCQKTPFDE